MAKICKYCRSQIDDKASVCPFCQRKQSDAGGALMVVIAVLLFVFIGIPFSVGFINGLTGKSRKSEISTEKVSVESSEKATSELPRIEKVVYEQNGIKITYTGIEEKTSRYELNFLIENDTDSDRTIIDDNLSVNSFMISSGLYSSVAAHKKINDSITIYKKRLEENKIAEIENVEFIFRIYEGDNFSSYFDTDTIKITVEQ